MTVNGGATMPNRRSYDEVEMAYNRRLAGWKAQHALTRLEYMENENESAVHELELDYLHEKMGEIVSWGSLVDYVEEHISNLSDIVDKWWEELHDV